MSSPSINNDRSTAGRLSLACAGAVSERLHVDGRSVSPLLRPNDVAHLLSVSRAWVYDAARSGRIPSLRLGGEDGPLRFDAEDIEQWLAEARAGWLPGVTRPSTAGALDGNGHDGITDADGSSVPIRGQQSLL
ncbi:MAG: helix-turn-helix domain-containing protein [Solirubrobacterales bacterium]|nr:helix-turn-helix domain-containing protein [Solirubrobacterales bacterium]